MNLTDIDDKIIRGAAAEGDHDRGAHGPLRSSGSSPTSTAPDDPAGRPAPRDRPHPADRRARQDAARHGHAYRTEDGSIFFRIASWPAYGRLARLDPEAMRVGERVEADEYGKDDVRDFALWKGPKPGEPSWDTASARGGRAGTSSARR